MKKWIKSLPVMFAAIVLGGVLFLSGCGSKDQAETEYDDSVLEIDAVIDMSTILDGIYIGDVDVGGMTSAQATAAIRSYVDDIADQTVMLSANDDILKTTVTELGFREDVQATIEEAVNYGRTGNVLKRYKEMKDLQQEEKELPLVLVADEDQVREYIEDHIWDVTHSAADYGLTLVNGEFVIEEGRAGQQLDVDESVDRIINYFASGWQENSTIPLAVDVIEPKGSAEELALVQDILGKFSTDYSSSSSARKTNIMTGASYIDGSVIYPGETFSVEEAVVPFDEEHGYEEAPSYENGTTVDSYGGGICQVSTTLYNAVIRAELDVVERYGHSMTVSYVDPSADAAIAEGTKDLKFTNNTDAPIYIAGYTDGDTITFTIYGHETRPSNRSVSFESETTEVIEPTVQYKASDADFGTVELVQSAHNGVQAQLWKIVTVDGVVESREVFNYTTYEMSPTIYEVGVNTSDAGAVTAIYAAIETQDLDKIYECINSYTSSYDSSDDDDDYDDYDDSDESSEDEPETEAEETASEDSGGGEESSEEVQADEEEPSDDADE